MKICLVCSEGGHLTQMLLLLKSFQDHECFFVTYCGHRGQGLAKTTKTYLLKNFGKNPLRLLFSLPRILYIFVIERPKVVVSTGSEIAIPFFYLAKLLRIKTIYIESWSRVYEPSRTGKIVYPIADVFLVQWKQLLSYYGRKARYVGGVI